MTAVRCGPAQPPPPLRAALATAPRACSLSLCSSSSSDSKSNSSSCRGRRPAEVGGGQGWEDERAAAALDGVRRAGGGGGSSSPPHRLHSCPGGRPASCRGARGPPCCSRGEHREQPPLGRPPLRAAGIGTGLLPGRLRLGWISRLEGGHDCSTAQTWWSVVCGAKRGRCWTMESTHRRQAGLYQERQLCSAAAALMRRPPCPPQRSRVPQASLAYIQCSRHKAQCSRCGSKHQIPNRQNIETTLGLAPPRCTAFSRAAM